MKNTVATDRLIKTIVEAVNKNCCEENKLAVGCFVMKENGVDDRDVARAFGIPFLKVIDHLTDFNRKLSAEKDFKSKTHIEKRDGYTIKSVGTAGFLNDVDDDENNILISVITERKLVLNYLNHYLK